MHLPVSEYTSRSNFDAAVAAASVAATTTITAADDINDNS